MVPTVSNLLLGSILGGFSSFGSSLRSLRLRILGGLRLLLGLRLERRDHDAHALTFKHRHQLYLPQILKIVGESEEEHLALLFEEDGASAEEDVVCGPKRISLTTTLVALAFCSF